MKNPKKALLLLLGVVVLVASSVFATLAYFTDSEAVTNTFSVGQVGIDLDELDVDNSETNVTPDSEPVRDKKNVYHLIPGSTYIKDPTVHVDADSEDAWLFVKVENGIADIEAPVDELGTIATQITSQKNGWTLLEGKTNIYYRAHTKSDEIVDYVVFKKFKIDGDNTVNVPDGATCPTDKFDIADYAEKEIKITAYAIQMAGFENNPTGAWTAGNWQ